LGILEVDRGKLETLEEEPIFKVQQESIPEEDRRGKI